MSADLAPHGLALVAAMPHLHVVAPAEPDDLTWHQADEITCKIRRHLMDLRSAIEHASDLVDATSALVERAWATRADQALGYTDWEAYVGEQFGSLGAVRLPVPERVRLVASLMDTDISRRGIGRALQVADQTVRADLRRAAIPAPRVEDEPTASEPGVVADGGTTRPPSKTSRTLADLAAAGAAGLTARELAAAHPGWACPWRVLSELHRTRRIARLTDVRGGHGVYVHPDHADGRETQPHGRRARAA